MNECWILFKAALDTNVTEYKPCVLCGDICETNDAELCEPCYDKEVRAKNEAEKNAQPIFTTSDQFPAPILYEENGIRYLWATREVSMLNKEKLRLTVGFDCCGKQEVFREYYAQSNPLGMQIQCSVCGKEGAFDFAKINSRVQPLP